MKPLTIYEPVDFSEDSWTERGERVWKTLKIVCHIQGMPQPVERVLQCDPGVGITEPFIEDTIQGSLDALARDYPHAVFGVQRLAPNHIVLIWVGTRTTEVN